MEARPRPLGITPIPRWFLVSVLLILLISVTSVILNRSTVHHRIQQYLKSEFGIETSAIHVQLVPTISLEVFDLLLRDDTTSQPILRAPRASLSVRLWPLLTQQTRIWELNALQPELVIRRDRDGVWHVPLRDEKHTSQPTSNTADPKWVMAGFHIVDGNLLILDEERLAAGGIRIHHVQGVFESHQAQHQAEITLAAKTEDGGDLQIHGSAALEKKLGPDRSTTTLLPGQFEGTFGFQHFNLAYWLERTGQSIPARNNEPIWQGNLSATIRLDLLQDTQGFNVTISDMQTDLGWVVIHGDGTIEHAGTNHPVYAIRFSTSPIGSDSVFAHVPPSWIPKTVRDVVDAHDLESTVELVSADLRGSIDVLRDPDEWNLVARLSHGSGIWGDKRTRIHDLSATVAMDPHNADITHFAGEVNGIRITSTKLTVSDLDLGPAVDAHLVGVGQLEDMLGVLQQFDGGTVGSSVVRNVTDLTGTLHMTVHVAGPLLPRPSLRLMKAEVQGQELGARLTKNFAITQLNGSIAADSRMLGIKHIQGVMQGIDFEAQGTVDLDAGARVTNLTMAMRADGTAMRDLLVTNFAVRPDMRIEGPTRAILSLSGTAGAAHCRSTIDLTDTDLMIPSVLHKTKGLPGRLEFEATILDAKRVIIEEVKLILFESEIQATGQIELSPTPKFHVHVKSGPISLPALVNRGVRIPMVEGIFETSAEVSGEGMDWKSWVPSGWITVRSGVVTLPGLDHELRDVSGRLQVTPGSAILDELSVQMGKSDVKLTGIVEHWRHDPRATLMVESSHFDTAQLFSNTNNNSAATSANLQDWIRSKDTTVAFVIKHLRYEQLVLRTVSGEIKVDPQKVKLNEFQGETPKGVFFGRGEGRFGTRQRVDLEAELDVDGIPAQDLLSSREGETEPLQGNLSMNGVMQARVEADRSIWNTLSTAPRGITVKVRDGRLQQDPVLTKVIKILNLPALLIGQVDLNQDGLPFHSLTARVVAKDGLFSSEDIVLDSPIMKVTGAGSADIKNSGLDLALAVSPLAAYSELIGKIPLFGPLLSGERPGLSTALFEAKGPLRDPEVSYLPLESFGKGLTGYPRLAIDVLVNTIKLPETALAYASH